MGARLACDILLHHRDKLLGGTHTRIGGNNMPTVRYCRGSGRLHGTTEINLLDPVLTELAALKRRMQWVVLSRNANVAAHICAGGAARLAAQRACSVDIHDHDIHHTFECDDTGRDVLRN